LHSFKIIIIEDEEAHFELMKRAIVREFPFASVYHFGDASSCLDQLDAIRPDVVIIDYLMPGMNGVEFLEILNQHEEDIPTIMITGQGDQNVAVRAMKLGAWDYLVKSDDFFSLLPSTIEKVIRERKLRCSLRSVERRFFDLAENTSDWIWEVDAEGKFVYSNCVAEKILGYTPAEIVGRTFFSFFPEDRQESQKKLSAQFMQESRSFSNFVQRVIHRDGYDVILEASGVPIIGENGSLEGYRGVSRDITRRKRSEEALRESEERFRSIFEESPIGIVIYDEDGCLTNMNLAALGIFGIPDITGALSFRLFEDPHLPEHALQKIYQGDMARVEMHYNFNRVRELHLFDTVKSGVIYVDVQIKPLHKDRHISGYLVQLQDITNRKRAEEALRVSNRFLEIANMSSEASPLLELFNEELKKLTGCSSVGIRLLEEDGAIPYAAQDGFREDFLKLENGLTVGDPGCLCADIISGKTLSDLPCYTKAGSFYLNGASRFLSKVCKAGGDGAVNGCNLIGCESVALTPIRLEDSVIGLIHIADPREDAITKDMVNILESVAMGMGVAIQRARTREELRKAHDELEQRVRERTLELASANEALVRSSEKLKLFAYSVVHDLKSPSIGIYGLARLLQRQYAHLLDEKGANYCEQILKASEYSSALIEKINHYVATKEAPLVIERLQLREVCETVQDEFAERLNERGIKWAAPETSVEFAADRLSIIRVLTNLVENALKYGGSMLSEIRIGYQATEKHHILSVSDDGVGIHREDCEKIFGLFQRNSTSKGIPGTGLGLSIVRETAERHHGKVWVEPAPDHGSIFYISIAKDF
jgi:PAS domain S-box-containing protein